MQDKPQFGERIDGAWPTLASVREQRQFRVSGHILVRLDIDEVVEAPVDTDEDELISLALDQAGEDSYPDETSLDVEDITLKKQRAAAGTLQLVLPFAS